MTTIKKFVKAIAYEDCFNVEFPGEIVDGGEFGGIVKLDHNEGRGGFMFIGNGGVVGSHECG